MSAIATVLVAMGHRVSGSDASDSPVLRRLSDLGARVVVGSDPAGLADAQVVVRSTAVPDTDAEVVAARGLGLTVWRRAEVLAAICAERRTIAVSGTHGKTTTSSMLAVTLLELGWHPSMIIGGEISGLGPGARWDGAGEWFVVEADESDGTFLELGAEAAVVTSVEADHLEFYGGMDGLVRAFEEFVAGPAGPVVVCADDPGAARLALRRGAGPILTYGTDSGADVVIADIGLDRRGARFEVRAGSRMGPYRGPVELSVPGLHNVRNATAALTLAVALGAGWEDAAAGVGRYRGVGRRFEGRGERSGVSFVDGYDHLPSEVSAAIATARSGGWHRVVAVFQPHRYSRTEALWRDFADSFVGADEVVITGVYSAGEPARPGITGRLIADAVIAAHPEARVSYAEDLTAAADLLMATLREGDVCLTLGAGDITTLPTRLIERFDSGQAGR